MSDKIISFADFKGKKSSSTNTAENREQLSFDYLASAIHSDSVDEAIEYVEKAIAADPDNYDAKLFRIEIDNNEIEKIAMIDELISVLSGDVGEVIYDATKREMDPESEMLCHNYLKCLQYKFLKLIELYRFSDAVDVGQEMLSISDEDPYKVRYALMSLYAYFEDDYSAENLFSKYQETSLSMLLPLSVLFFRIGEYEHSKTLVLRIHNQNRHVYEYLSNIEDYDEYIPDRDYSEGSIDEAVLVLQANEFLIDPCIPYIDFMLDCIEEL